MTELEKLIAEIRPRAKSGRVAVNPNRNALAIWEQLYGQEGAWRVVAALALDDKWYWYNGSVLANGKQVYGDWIEV